MADMLGVVVLNEDDSLSFTLQCTRKDLGKDEWSKLIDLWPDGKHIVRNDAKLLLGRVTIKFDTSIPLVEIYNDEYVDATRNKV